MNFLTNCLINDDGNYILRPITAIMRFLSESIVVVFHRISMVMSRW